MASDKVIANTIAHLAETYQRKLSEELVNFYRDMLRPMDDAIIEEAAHAIMLSSEFFPTPAAFLKMARTMAGDHAGIPAPDVAWDSVLVIARQWHHRMTIEDKLAQPIVAALRQIGGMRRVALAGDSGREGDRERELATMKKEFVHVYGATYEALATAALGGTQSLDAIESDNLPRLPATTNPDARVSNMPRIGERLPRLPQRTLREGS